MAGDWLKMRIDLNSHPKVVRILSATGTDKFRVIGGLHAVWSVFDQHSTDGVLAGYTPALMDHVIGWEGFCQAMVDVGWLEYDGAETLVMPEFSEHNGKSGKRRAEDQKRKRDSRNRPQSVRNLSADDEDTNRTREEKRREENKNPPKAPPLGGQRNRGARLPDDWELPAEWRQWAAENAPAIDPDREAAKFRDYWHAKAGTGAAKKDWLATWRNWCRMAEERGGRPQGAPERSPYRKTLGAA